MAGNLTAMIAAAFSGGAAPPVTSDPYYPYTTLLLPGNGTNGAQNNTFLDGSTNNFTITRNGNTTQGTFSPFSQTGWGNYFDGSSYLTANGGTAANLGTTWTVECWLYPTNVSGTGAIVNVNINTANQGINIYRNGATITVDNGVTASTGPSGGTLVANTWQHVAVVADGTNTRIYLNGSQVGSTFTGTVTSGTPTHFWIGSALSGLSLWAGYISNVRIVKGVAVYTGTFTPPISPIAATQSAGTNISAITGTQTSLLTCQSNRFIDNSTNNFTITRSGSPTVVAFSPFNPSASWSAATYGGSGYFDGNGDYLSVASSGAQPQGTEDWCIEMWIYLTTISTTTDTPWIEVSTNNGVQIYTTTSGTVLAFGIYGIGSVTTYTLPSGITNAWNHFVFTRSSNAWRLMHNGVLRANGTSSASLSTGTMSIFSRGASNYSTGYCGLTRVVRASIPTEYQTSSTTNGTSIYTVPTAPATTTSQGATSGDVELLLTFTNAGIYDATSKNDLETVGDAKISTAQSKWGGSSMAFDGTTDYLLTNVASSDLYSFGLGDWTVEFWVRFNNTTGDGCIFDTRNATDTLNVTILRSTTTILFQTGGSTRITSGTITSNVWYHIAVARSGTSTKMFIDGTQAGSTYTDTTSYTAGANRPIIGAVSLSGFVGISALNGYIQDLRVTKGYARYTSNFTAPTSAFPTL